MPQLVLRHELRMGFFHLGGLGARAPGAHLAKDALASVLPNWRAQIWASATFCGICLTLIEPLGGSIAGTSRLTRDEGATEI